MVRSLDEALDLYYSHREEFWKVQARAMDKDFSWSVAAEKYEKMLQQVKKEPPHIQ
jgi:glycogen synthase